MALRGRAHGGAGDALGPLVPAVPPRPPRPGRGRSTTSWPRPPTALVVAGAALRGLGVPACIRQGADAAGRVLAALDARP